jgi:hypothetical protein
MASFRMSNGCRMVSIKFQYCPVIPRGKIMHTSVYAKNNFTLNQHRICMGPFSSAKKSCLRFQEWLLLSARSQECSKTARGLFAGDVNIKHNIISSSGERLGMIRQSKNLSVIRVRRLCSNTLSRWISLAIHRSTTMRCRRFEHL